MTTDIRQKIALQLNAYRDLQALRAALWDWVNQSDVSLMSLEKILAAHQSAEIHYTEADWQHLQETGFTFETDEATIKGDLQRLQRYRETKHGIPHEQVAAWLSSIGTDDELPCPN
ncbi:MAG TPA: hypothetical protein DDZ80_10455 [Cyanobacteria bacterium UBA8803]|nr:hypothetical protein [Cyanobacteria bacterium UBA9273]HBL58912.1 hypothetical protein [Cyanobacteria bacterium UBA8803]